MATGPSWPWTRAADATYHQPGGRDAAKHPTPPILPKPRTTHIPALLPPQALAKHKAADSPARELAEPSLRRGDPLLAFY